MNRRRAPHPARALAIWLLLALWPLHAWTAAVGVVRGIAHVHVPPASYAAGPAMSLAVTLRHDAVLHPAMSGERLHAADGRGLARFAEDYAIAQDEAAVHDEPAAHHDHGPLSDHHHAHGTHGVILVADETRSEANDLRLFARAAASLTDALAEPVAIVVPSCTGNRPTVAQVAVPPPWYPPPIERPPR